MTLLANWLQVHFVVLPQYLLWRWFMWCAVCWYTWWQMLRRWLCAGMHNGECYVANVHDVLWAGAHGDECYTAVVWGLLQVGFCNVECHVSDWEDLPCRLLWPGCRHGEAQTTGQSIAVTLPKNVPEGCILLLVSRTEAI
jgi:hypothetical protein